jgi:hypothetical protein
MRRPGRARWPIVAVAVATATLAGGPLSSAGSTRRGASVHVTPATALAQQAVTITGTGWAPPHHGCTPVVRLRAYVAGLSPYGAHTIASASLTAAGTFKRRWVTPPVIDSLTWTIRARRTCSGRTTLAYTTLTIG